MGRVYVQVVHPMRHVKMNMSGGISGAIFKALYPRDVSKFLYHKRVFLRKCQGSLGLYNREVYIRSMSGGMSKGVCPREYV